MTTIVGIDCATQARKVGLALAHFDGQRASIEQVTTGRSNPIVETVAAWIKGEGAVLLALDAPLGWPLALGQTLHEHQAGDSLPIEPNKMFRRLTDRVIRHEIGKQSLDVGADRIARTAHSALMLLQALRETTGEAITLAWHPSRPQSRIRAIEVYPAATMRVYRITVPGYRRKDGRLSRQIALQHLKAYLDFPTETALLEKNTDALDAAICVLASVDFLQGRALEPTDMELVRKEGWIWVRKPDFKG